VEGLEYADSTQESSIVRLESRNSPVLARPIDGWFSPMSPLNCVVVVWLSGNKTCRLPRPPLEWVAFRSHSRIEPNLSVRVSFSVDIV
jgi:hypothetical protein